MKAVVNGVQVEGTPQEIAEYVRLVGASFPWAVHPQTIPDEYAYKPLMPQITCGSIAK